MADSDIASEMLTHVHEIDEAGELPLAARRRLADQLVHRLDNFRAVRFRAILGLTCAKKVWPIWRSVFLTDSWPMDFAESTLTNLESRQEARAMDSRQLMEIKTYLDEKFLLGDEYFPAVYAGFASWAVARDILARNRNPIIGDSELQIPPDEWEPCFLASLALTGGATWERIGRSESRREFWEWYLTSAVPNAFTVASSRRVIGN